MDTRITPAAVEVAVTRTFDISTHAARLDVEFIPDHGAIYSFSGDSAAIDRLHHAVDSATALDALPDHETHPEYTRGAFELMAETVVYSDSDLDTETKIDALLSLAAQRRTARNRTSKRGLTPVEVLV